MPNLHKSGGFARFALLAFLVLLVAAGITWQVVSYYHEGAGSGSNGPVSPPLPPRVQPARASVRTVRTMDIAGMLSAAREIAASIANPLVQDAARERIAVVEAELGRFPAAMQIAVQIHNFPRRDEARREIAVIQAKAGDVAGALRTLGEIASKPASMSQNQSLEEIAVAQARAGDISGAKNTTDGIDNADIQADVLGDIAEAQCQSGDAAAALKTAGGIHGDKKWDAYRRIAAVQAAGGDPAGAEKTAAVIELADCKMSACSSIADAYANAGDIQGFKRMAALADGRDEKTSWYFNDLVLAMARAGDIAGATRAAQVQSAGGMASPFLVADGAQAHAYLSIALAQLKSGDAAGAKQAFHLARKAADASQIDQDIICQAIALAQARSGDLAGAQQTADAIKTPETKIQAYCEIAMKQLKPGDVATIRTFLASAQKAAETGLSKGPNICYRYIVDLQLVTGDFAAARQNTGLLPTAGDRNSAYQAIAEAQSAAGDLAGVLRWINGLTDSTDQISAFLGAAKGLAAKRPNTAGGAK